MNIHPMNRLDRYTVHGVRLDLDLDVRYEIIDGLIYIEYVFLTGTNINIMPYLWESYVDKLAEEIGDYHASGYDSE
jgi:hypothetical protein